MMDDLDFTRPARRAIFDLAISRACFESLGTSEAIEEGQSFFAKGETSDTMSLLLEGEASIVLAKKIVDIDKTDEIVSEPASVGQPSRTTSAVEETDYSLLAINR